MVQDAARAVRLARLAYTAAVEDEEVGEKDSLLFGHYSQEITLYLLGVALARQSEPVRETPDVGVYDYTLAYAEGVAQDHVGGLTAHPGESNKLGHTVRDLSSTLFNERAGHIPYGASLIAKKAYWSYLLLQLLEVGGCIVLRCAVLLEQLLRDLVHPDIGALGGKHRGH